VIALIVVAVTQLRLARARQEERERENIQVQAWKLLLFGSFIIYPSVSATILKVWHCRQIEDSYWVVADYRLRCTGPDGTDPEWLTNALIALGAFFIYPVGVPLFYIYQLKNNQAALYDKEHPEHEAVEAKFSFLYAAYEEQAWYWEVVMLLQKLLLTGLLIFIKPGTVSQLACGFVISIIFFIIHVRTNAYIEDVEDDLQFAAMFSITMTLFGAILLKTDTQDEDPYGSAVLTGILFGLNMGMIVMFFWQGFLVLTKPPDPSMLKVQKQALIRIATKGLEKCQPHIESGVSMLGLEPESAAALSVFLAEAIGRIPIALRLAGDIDDVVRDMQDSLFSSGFEAGPKILDKLFRLTIKIIGKKVVARMLAPMVGSMIGTVLNQISAATGIELDEVTRDRFKALGSGMTRYLLVGLNPFYRKWIKELREAGYNDPQVLIARLEVAFGAHSKEGLEDSEGEEEEQEG